MSHIAADPPTEGEDGERFLSNAELRRRYNKSRMTIYRWQQAGHLPAPHLAGGKLPVTKLSELRTNEDSWPRAVPTGKAAADAGTHHSKRQKPPRR